MTVKNGRCEKGIQVGGIETKTKVVKKKQEDQNTTHKFGDRLTKKEENKVFQSINNTISNQEVSK